MNTKHTPEPWQLATNGAGVPCIYAAKRHSVPIAQLGEGIDEEREALPGWRTNGARIVACVNACAGLEDPAREIAALRAERDELADCLDDAATWAAGRAPQKALDRYRSALARCGKEGK